MEVQITLMMHYGFLVIIKISHPIELKILKEVQRNYGASMARGKYLNFFDSDDIALENHTRVASSKILELNNPPLFNLSYAYKFENKIKNVVLSEKLTIKFFQII